MYTKLAIFLYLMSSYLPVFAINASLYYDPSENPPSSCMILYFKGNEPWHRLCSGDIKGKDKLLTAGHCAIKDDEMAIVRCPNQDQREWLVKGQLIHPFYPNTEETSPFDHALFQIESDFSTFEPAPLPQNDKEMYSLLEKECAIFGYGLDSFGNAGSLLGAPIIADFNSSLGFEMFGTMGGPSYTEEGDSGGGLFCKAHHDSKWIRIATLSQIGEMNGERVMLAAPLSHPIVDWIEKSLETDLPPVASFRREPVPLQTVPLEEMETPEDCTLRLVQTAASNLTSALEQISEAELKQVLATEIAHQCGLIIPQKSLNLLLVKYRRQRVKEEQKDTLVEKILSGAKNLPTQVSGLSVGEAINIPGWQWVDVVKSIENQYSNGSSMLEKGESCGIKYEGSLKILGFSFEGEKALVEYSSPGDDLGTPCPNGALFFISAKELTLFEERYARRVISEEQRDALVEKILSGAKDLPTQVSGLSVGEAINVPEWQWVDVVRSIENQYSNGSFMLEKGESCGIKYEGSLKILGFSFEGEKALVEYSSPGDDLGTPCPNGALFFISTEELTSFEELAGKTNIWSKVASFLETYRIW